MPILLGLNSYADLNDLDRCGIPPKALAQIDPTVREQALVDGSAEADGYLGDAVTLPLVAPYDRQLVRTVCKVAAWNLMGTLGFNPDDPGDKVIRTGYEDAQKWLVRVANKQVKLNVTQGSPASVQPDLASNCPRGYGDIFGTNGRASDDPAAGGNWGT